MAKRSAVKNRNTPFLQATDGTLQGAKVDSGQHEAGTADPAACVSRFNPTTENIGWARWSWNPVTGCRTNCEYCYARQIAMRFDGHFNPTFHENRLTAPANTKPLTNTPAGSRVFVCSMADLFGPWVPDEWILRVLEQVQANPQWTFLFLTKYPGRYESIVFPGNAWIGATVDVQDRVAPTEAAMAKATASKRFVSCEPLLEPVHFTKPELFEWIIIGARSIGAKKIQPPAGWVLDLILQAHTAGRHLWIKDNLRIQEDPTPDTTACVANRERGFYEQRAKERQRAGGKKAGRGRTQQGKEPVPYPIPDHPTQARDQAAEAAGVSGRLADEAADEAAHQAVLDIEAECLAAQEFMASHCESNPE